MGRLLRNWQLGEHDMYHASGLAFDGESVWAPTSEYRPDSNAIMYRIDPSTGEAAEVFRDPDRLGGVSRDPGSGRMFGVALGRPTHPGPDRRRRAGPRGRGAGLGIRVVDREWTVYGVSPHRL